eukprot:4379935-Prymnesium_polylepis.1
MARRLVDLRERVRPLGRVPLKLRRVGCACIRRALHGERSVERLARRARARDGGRVQQRRSGRPPTVEQQVERARGRCHA